MKISTILTILHISKRAIVCPRKTVTLEKDKIYCSFLQEQHYYFQPESFQFQSSKKGILKTININ